MTSPHEPATTADQSASAQTTPLPPFVFVPRDGDTVRVDREPWTWDQAPDADQPAVHEAPRARRWTTGHSVAAAVVAVGVLVAGGVAVAARDSGSAGTVAGGQLPAAANGGQQPPSTQGQGQVPGQSQQPGQDPLGGTGQLDIGQLGDLLDQLSSGQLDSGQLQELLSALGLPDQLDASQLQSLLQQFGGQLPGGLLPGTTDGGGGTDGGGTDGGGTTDDTGSEHT